MKMFNGFVAAAAADCLFEFWLLLFAFDRNFYFSMMHIDAYVDTKKIICVVAENGKWTKKNGKLFAHNWTLGCHRWHVYVSHFVKSYSVCIRLLCLFTFHSMHSNVAGPLLRLLLCRRMKSRFTIWCAGASKRIDKHLSFGECIS